MELHPTSEALTSQGRIDLVIELLSTIYIFKLKYNQSGRIALSSLLSRVYKDQFLYVTNYIIVLGLNFSSAVRNLTDWCVLVYNAKGEELRRLGSLGG